MVRKLGTWRTAALAVAVTLSLTFMPAGTFSAVVAGLRVGTNTMLHSVGSVAVPPKSADPIRAAVLNVTTDFDELAHLLVEFLRGQTEETRQQFREFMAERATRSYPRLEGLLDWLLSIYKFAFPFLIISVVAKLSGGNGQVEEAEGPAVYESANEGLGPKHHSPGPPRSSRLHAHGHLHPEGQGRLLGSAGLGDGGGSGGSLSGGRGAGLGCRALSGAQQAQRLEDLGEGEALPGVDLAKGLSYPVRVLPRSSSTGNERGTLLAPSTPSFEVGSRLPPHPAQLQGKR